MYRHDPLDANSLSDNVVLAMKVDHTGTLWIGTLNGGLNRYDPEQDRFHHYRHSADDPQSLDYDKVYSIHEDRSGILWIGTSTGLNRYDRQTDSFTHFIHDPEDAHTLGGRGVLSIVDDPQGTLWVGTISGGLSRLDPETKRFQRYYADANDPTSLPHNHVRCLAIDRTGTLWIGTKGGGLSKMDAETGRFSSITPGPGKAALPPDALLRVIVELPSDPGALWMGSYGGGGLKRFDIKTARFQSYTHDARDTASLGDDVVSAIFEDRSQVLWVGTWHGGLSKTNLGRKKFHHWTHVPGDETSLSHRLAYEILEDREGVVWVATWGGGLCSLDPQGSKPGRFRCHRHEPDDPRSLSGDMISSLFEDRNGDIWIGTNGKGLNRLDRATGRFTRYRIDLDDPRKTGANFVGALFQPDDDKLWLATQAGGVIEFDPGSGKAIHRHFREADRETLRHKTISGFFEDHRGDLWLSSMDGLYRIDAGRTTARRYMASPGNPSSLGSNAVNQIYTDRSGRMWIGTYGGLCLYDVHTDTFRTFTTRDGLANNVINCILEDRLGHLWVSTNKGLTRIQPESMRFRNYSRADGLRNLEFNTYACARSTKGEMMFAGTAGITHFLPEEIVDDRNVPPVVITSVRSGNRELTLERDPAGIYSLDLTYRDTILSCEFAALSFAHPHRNQYAYQLEGLTEGWIELGPKHDITITNLDPGEHVLRIKGSNHDGVWNHQGVAIRLSVAPPFWKSWWFSTLSVLLFAFAAYFVIHLVQRHLRLVMFWKRKNYIGHYRIVDQLGSGGMGVVYRAMDVLSDSGPIALKVIREEFSEDPSLRRRFLNEGAIIDQLDHPNIVKVRERGEHEGRLYMAMEMVAGDSLAYRILDEQPIAPSECHIIMQQLTEAVSKVHSKGIVHRDLKPDNIMLVRNGDTLCAKLLDFGLATTQSLTRLTAHGMFVGTIGYLAPELITDHRYSSASDIYALGVVFYEMWTREKPFFGESAIDIIKQVLVKEPLPPCTFRPDTPRAIDALILQMMVKDPRQRPSLEHANRILRGA